MTFKCRFLVARDIKGPARAIHVGHNKFCCYLLYYDKCLEPLEIYINMPGKVYLRGKISIPISFFFFDIFSKFSRVFICICH
jgi:hypothetical protein